MAGLLIVSLKRIDCRRKECVELYLRPLIRLNGVHVSVLLTTFTKRWIWPTFCQCVLQAVSVQSTLSAYSLLFLLLVIYFCTSLPPFIVFHFHFILFITSFVHTIFLLPIISFYVCFISWLVFDPLLLREILPPNYNNEPSIGHVREGSMCLQLLALRTIVNVEIAPKKENWIAQLGHRVTHISVLLTVCDDQGRQPVHEQKLTNEQRNARQRQSREGGRVNEEIKNFLYDFLH